MNCLDADLEPNDTPATATSLDSALQSPPTGMSLYGLEICTPSDIDYYSFTLTATMNVTITVQFQSSDGDLSATLEDSADSVKASGVSTLSGLQITALGLPAGVYYLKVTAGPGGTTNNYEFSLSIGGGGPQGPDGGVDAATDAAACAASAVAARHLPLDIYLMLNQSSSMSDTVSGGTKWSAIRSALDTFLQQPLTDVSVGIGFFGVPPTSSQCTVTTCAQDSDCGPAACGPCDPVSLTCAGATSQDSCAPADYANPAVEIAPLPGVYGGIHAAVLAHGPSTHTPTSAALQGAVDHASSWGGFYPQHVTIVILTTDGEPNECDTSPTHIEAIAAGGVAGTPKILTFVIGVGSSVSTLSGIANAGGTSTAFIIDTGGSVQQQFLQAMNQIRGEALGCVYEIPGSGDAGVLDSSRINVQYTPGSGGAAQVIPMAPDRASCPVSGDAWYYDTASAPSRILLCPNTCSRITPDTSGEVDILLGCATEVIG